jgi:predicted anti-sigma-YlaC factor YlaD
MPPLSKSACGKGVLQRTLRSAHAKRWRREQVLQCARYVLPVFKVAAPVLCVRSGKSAGLHVGSAYLHSTANAAYLPKAKKV